MDLRITVAVFSLALVIASCQKPEIQGGGEKAVLRRVEVSASEGLTLKFKESTVLTFKVEDPEFPFSPGDVALFLSSGKVATDFSVNEVQRGQEAGTYSAVISDAGTSKEYSYTVRLGIRSVQGVDVFVFSSPFLVRSQGSGLHGVTLHTGLPVIYLDTEGSSPIVSKEDYLTATFTLWDEEDGLGEPLSCSVRGRGNTTWEWPKKPYLVKMDKKQSLLGMKEHKRWVLLANFMDRTLIRNLVAMRVSSFTSLDWTPSCRPVELVLNGSHVGCYLLIEQVRVDKNRVPVEDGFLLESDFHYDNEVQWMDPHGSGNMVWEGIPFGVKYPDSEDLTPAQLSYIKEYIHDTAEALYGPDFTDLERGYAAYIDVDSFVDYWIVFEVMGNHELGNPGSVYYHKKMDGKLVAGPCWDFDWGILSYRTSPQARTGLINGKACWYARLFEDPSFRAKVKTRYRELLPKLVTIPDYIETLRTELSESARLNFQMWNPAQDASMNNGSIINGDENMSYDSAIDRLKSIYEERLSIIEKNL